MSLIQGDGLWKGQIKSSNGIPKLIIASKNGSFEGRTLT
jgi:hypothetical protein